MLFAFVLGLVQNVPAETVAPAVAGIGIAATALIALMRKHRIKNKELAEQLGLSGKDVTQARKFGITDSEQAQKWQNAITSKPAPEPKARRRKRKPRFQAEQAEQAPAVLNLPGHQHHKLLLPANLASLARLAAKNEHARFGATKIVPKDKPRLSVSVDAKLLIELLQVASAFTSEDHNHKVTINFYDSKRPFVVRTRTDEGQEFTGMAVPLAPDTANQKAA